MKLCPRCNTEKPLAEFNVNSGRKHGVGTYCRECTRVYDRDYYANNPALHGTMQRRQKTRRDRNSQYVWNFLAAHPCVDCPESDPIVLDFDHREGATKVEAVSKLSKDAASIRRLQEEIDKCDVRCANCHRRRTAKQFNWYSRINVSA